MTIVTPTVMVMMVMLTIKTIMMIIIIVIIMIPLNISSDYDNNLRPETTLIKLSKYYSFEKFCELKNITFRSTSLHVASMLKGLRI